MEKWYKTQDSTETLEANCRLDNQWYVDANLAIFHFSGGGGEIIIKSLLKDATYQLI